MDDADLADWTFEVSERSAGVYEGLGSHPSGANVHAVGTDPEELLDRLRAEARETRRP